MSMPFVILLIALGISALPVWVPLFREKTLPSKAYRFALYATALSQAAQAYFILGGLPANALPLTESAGYAAFGLLLSLVGAGLAWFDRRGTGCWISAMFTSLLWLFLMSAH